jgi:hypothetical protein
MAAGSKPKPQPEFIPLQIGSELRLTQRGEIRLGNPTLEVNEVAADAVIAYYFDPQTNEHVIRLVDPFVRRH